MVKQLIVVVHGVGINKAGVTSNLLATSIEGSSSVPNSSENFELAEQECHDANGLHRTFTGHVQKYKNGNKDRVYADFYWGDISQIKNNVLGVIYAIITIILGLCHPIRENASDIYKDHPKLLAVVHWIVKLIHGPIVAINLVLLLGAFVAFAVDYFEFLDVDGWYTPVIAAVVIVFLAEWFRRREYSYLSRLLASWTMMFAVLLVLFEGATHIGLLNKSLVYTDQYVFAEVCKKLVFVECYQSFAGIYKHAARLIILMALGWVVLLFLMLFLLIATILNQSVLRKTENFVLPAVMLMVGLWIITITGIWYAVSQLPFNVIPNERLFYSAMNLMPFVVFLMGATILSALWVTFLKAISSDLLKPVNYMANAEKFSEKYRLIVSAPTRYTLVIGFILLMFLAILSIAESMRPDDFGESVRAILAYFEANIGLFITGIGLVSVAIVSFGPTRIGLEILQDVIVYINDYSWNSRKSYNLDSLTWLEKTGLVKIKKPGGVGFHKIPNRRGYYPRERLKDRLNQFVRAFIAREKPDELIILAHSQGTVIAIDVTDENGREWLASLNNGRKKQPAAAIRLITMGSPYIHIHNKYFPDSFKNIANRPNIKSVAKKGVLKDWINIFRTNDFVGTHIDPNGQWPKEHPVFPRGHTNYWTDVEVAEILGKHL